MNQEHHQISKRIETRNESEFERLHALRREYKAIFLTAQRQFENARFEMDRAKKHLTHIENLLDINHSDPQLEFELDYSDQDPT